MKATLSLLLFIVCFTSTGQPFRSAVFTGNASTDFTANEKNFSSGIAYCLTWDASFVYLGVTGGSAYIKQEPTLFYFDTDPNVPAVYSTGNTVGFQYDNRAAALPFAANVVVYCKEGYAEVRTSPSTNGSWGDAVVYTANITTGSNDIEIKIPWTAFPNGIRPTSLSWLCFKTNGNASQKDAYEIRPGTSNVATTYSFDINNLGPSLFYRVNTTADKYYPGVNIFSWVDNTLSTMCPPSATSSSTNITSTSAKLSWAAINGATQYLLRGRKKGTALWQAVVLPGNRSSFTAVNLICNTNYEWHIRTVCDTTQLVDINSGFSVLQPFKTLTCALNAGDAFMLYPSPAKAGADVMIRYTGNLPEMKFVIKSVSGVVMQMGNIHNNMFQLGAAIKPGIYMVELYAAGQVIHKQLQVE